MTMHTPGLQAQHDALAALSSRYVNVDALPWQDTSFPGIRIKVLMQDPESGMQTVRQIEYSLFDMRAHTVFDPNGERDLLQLIDDVRREVAVSIPPAFNRFANSFGHIFAGAGYAAGYYS